MKKILAAIILFSVIGLLYSVSTRINLNPKYNIGEPIDSLHGINVYYNGGVNHISGRNLTKDGYNLGLYYQCVEFVKRYYYRRLKHKMPDSYGHAKDFYDRKVKDGSINKKRNLYQYDNGSNKRFPLVGDILIYKPSILNRFGHVSIVSNIQLDSMTIEIIQQNAGPFSPTRESYSLSKKGDRFYVDNQRIIGWLSKK